MDVGNWTQVLWKSSICSITSEPSCRQNFSSGLAAFQITTWRLRICYKCLASSLGLLLTSSFSQLKFIHISYVCCTTWRSLFSAQLYSSSASSASGWWCLLSSPCFLVCKSCLTYMPNYCPANPLFFIYVYVFIFIYFMRATNTDSVQKDCSTAPWVFCEWQNHCNIGNHPYFYFLIRLLHHMCF